MRNLITLLATAFVASTAFVHSAEINESSGRRLATKYPTKKTASPSTSPVTPTASPTYKDGVDPTKYNIEIVFSDDTPDIFREAFTKAKNRWESVVKSDIPNSYTLKKGASCFKGWTKQQEDKIVDDLLIFAKVTKIDGPGKILGNAGPCIATKDPRIYNRVGLMQFDEADVQGLLANGTFEIVVLHEIGHLVGIGTVWNAYDLIDRPKKKKGAAYYNGEGGTEGQAAVGGTGEAVIETNGGRGTAYGHWDEDTYDTELMTGWMDRSGNYLSKLTILSLKDLGFEVDETQADPYTIPTGLRGSEPGHKVHLGNDIIAGPVVEGEVNPY